MHIFKNQMLYYKNVLSYRTTIKIEDTNKLISFIQKNTDALNLKICGNIITTIHGKETLNDMKIVDIEFLIPVDKKLKRNFTFKFKPIFKLINAVKIRHEGSMETLNQTEKILNQYICDNNLHSVTRTYYLFVQSTEFENSDNIVDIYKGISENIL